MSNLINTNKILIVDDEKFNCDIIYGFMMVLGVANRSAIAEFAFNGEEAFNLV
jgi:CheY-like chemotaxis protein